MKKTLLSIFCALFCLCAAAQSEKTYNEQYVVTTNGIAAEPQDATITVVDNGDGTINFVIKDFIAKLGGNETPVGDISLNNVPAQTDENGLTYFNQEGTFDIPLDNMPPEFEPFAQAGYFNDVPYTLQGKLNDEKLYASLEIDMSRMGQNISVEVGTDDFGTTPEPEGKVYTEPLVITINGESTEPQDASVTVIDNGDGTINFVLNNFFLGAGENSIPVGNIRIDNLPVTVGEDGLTYISYEGPLTIQPGNMEGMSDTDWLGPMIGEIPLALQGKMNDEKLFVTIDIDLQALLGQIVYVQLGTDDFGTTPEPEGKVYTEPLVVTVNGESTEPQDASVTVVDNGDGTINFVLNNFFLGAGENSIPVGNIRIDNLPVTVGEDGLTYISYDGPLTIQPGNMEGMSDTDWLGPMIGEIPLALQGKMNDEKLFVTIDIDLQALLGQIVYVQLGTDDFGTTPEPEGKVYTEPLVITINGESTEPQDASVTVVDNGDGTINFVLNNFFLGAGENSIPVGNIRIDNLPVTVGEDGLTYISYDGPLTIQPGNMEGMSDTDWLGPMIGEIPLALQGKMNDEKLFVTIDIDLQALLGQNVYVQLGTDDFGTTPEPEGKVYTEPLVITINGESTEPQDASVTVIDNGDGTINFVLNNFFLGAGENSIPVGNIRIDNLPVTVGEDGLTYISYDGPLTIQPGNMEGMSDTDWLGPMIGEIPLALQGKMNDEKLFVTIDIDLQALLGQNVYVQLGTDDFGTTPEPEGKVYTEPLVVTVNGESTEPQDASVTVIDNGDGTINFVLNNFFLGAGENSIPVGNIRIDNLPVTVGEDGLTYISYDGPLTIQPGNMEGMSNTDWLGPMIGEIPLALQGKMNDEKLFVTIDIDLQALLGQNVYVQLGTDDFFPVVLTGDANEDGEVDVADATFILNVMADEADEPKADVNGDGEVDVADYTYVLNLMADE